MHADVLVHGRGNASDVADVARAISASGYVLHVQGGLRANEAPGIGRRQDGATHVLRHRTFVKATRSKREVGERVDRRGRRANPVPDLIVEAAQVVIDLVSQSDGGRLDVPLVVFLDAQRQVLRRERPRNVLAGVHRERKLAFDNVLIDGNRAIVSNELDRAAHADRVADLDELAGVVAIDFLTHDQVVFELG